MTSAAFLGSSACLNTAELSPSSASFALYAYSLEIPRNLCIATSQPRTFAAPFMRPRLLRAPVKTGGELVYGTALLRRSQIAQDAFLVGRSAFLAEFEFAFELLDLHLEANNPGHQPVFVCLGQIPEIVSRLIAFEFTDEPGQHVVK